jgi:hypothetical protein
MAKLRLVSVIFLSALALHAQPSQPPIPRQATEITADISSKVKDDPANNKRHSNASSAANNDRAPNEADKGDKKGSATKDTAVKIAELPKVAVSVERDQYDRSYWAFSGLLVLVGALQIILLWRTWKTMDDQAKKAIVDAAESAFTTKATLQALKQQADAMDKQNKAIRDRERARLTLINPTDSPDFVSPIRIIDDEPELYMEVGFAIHNDGASKAFNVRGWGGMVVQDTPEPFTIGNKKPLTIPTVIREATLEDPIHISVSEVITDRDSKLAEAVDEDGDAKGFFFVYGEIIYDDVFGEKHRTPFRFLWDVVNYWEGQQWGDASSWVNQSPPST